MTFESLTAQSQTGPFSAAVPLNVRVNCLGDGPCVGLCTRRTPVHTDAARIEHAQRVHIVKVPFEEVRRAKLLKPSDFRNKPDSRNDFGRIAKLVKQTPVFFLEPKKPIRLPLKVSQLAGLFPSPWRL